MTRVRLPLPLSNRRMRWRFVRWAEQQGVVAFGARGRDAWLSEDPDPERLLTALRGHPDCSPTQDALGMRCLAPETAARPVEALGERVEALPTLGLGVRELEPVVSVRGLRLATESTVGMLWPHCSANVRAAAATVGLVDPRRAAAELGLALHELRELADEPASAWQIEAIRRQLSWRQARRQLRSGAAASKASTRASTSYTRPYAETIEASNSGWNCTERPQSSYASAWTEQARDRARTRAPAGTSTTSSKCTS